MKLGKIDRLLRERGDGRVAERDRLSVQQTVSSYGFSLAVTVVTEQPPLTPWPCHVPTQKEIEDAQTEGVATQLQETGVLNSEDIQMVYSTVHG